MTTTTTPTGETTRRLVSGRADPDEAYRVPNINAEFELAPDLQDIANTLIVKKFPDFPECAITYVWKGRGGSTNGAATLGKTVKATGLTGFFSKVDYVIWLAADHVYDEKMTRYQVEAALFHELCHIGFEEDEGDVTLTMNPHDFEGFRREIEEYGFWKPDVAAIAVTVQGRLELDDPREARARLRRQTEVEEPEPTDLPGGIDSITFSDSNGDVLATLTSEDAPAFAAAEA